MAKVRKNLYSIIRSTKSKIEKSGAYRNADKLGVIMRVLVADRSKALCLF